MGSLTGAVVFKKVAKYIQRFLLIYNVIIIYYYDIQTKKIKFSSIKIQKRIKIKIKLFYYYKV